MRPQNVSSFSTRRPSLEGADEPATLKEVARRAGVSLSTASLVLNERPGTRIAAETRCRVWQAARELHYRIQRAHRRLRLRYLIGDGYYPVTPYERLPVFAAAQDEAERRGSMLEVRFAGQELSEQRRCLDAIAEGGVDGVLVAASLELGALERLLELSIPAVMVGSVQVHPRLSSVYSDSSQGTRLLIDHLRSLGHRRIAFCGVTQENFYEEQRFQTYHALCMEAAAAPELVCWTDRSSDRLERWLDALLALPAEARPTAIFADREPVGRKLQLRLEALGVRVPQEISFVCYDERDPFQPEGPSVTCVRRSGEAITRLAVSRLLEEMAHPELPRVRILLPGELVTGESSGRSPLLVTPRSIVRAAG